MPEIETINPKNGETIKSYSVNDKNDIKDITKKAHNAQKQWAELPLKERLKLLKQLRNLMLDKQVELCEDLALDTGKSYYEALIGEFVVSLGIINYYLKESVKILKRKRIRHRLYKNKKSYISYEPMGVVAVISPWNYPLLLSIAPIVSALISGNAVIFKPSEYTPYIGEKMHALFLKAGFPKDLFSIIYGDGKVGDILIHDNINKICFTGSVKTGKHIAKVAAEKLIPVTLELGGKDPFIVLADAPLERAAKAAVWGSVFNGGQTCAGVERIIVEKSVSTKFIDLLKTEISRLQFNQKNREVAGLNNEKQYKLVTEQLKDAEKNSQEVFKKELPEDLEGLYNVPPAIVIEPGKDSKIFKNETFGPLATVVLAENADEAIVKANDSEYGLTASLWTKNNKKAKKYADRIQAGSVYINDHLAPQAAPEIPWGGIKSSGIGRTRAEDGLLSMCNAKHISYDRLKLNSELFWFPYTEKKEKFFNKITKFIKWL